MVAAAQVKDAEDRDKTLLYNITKAAVLHGTKLQAVESALTSRRITVAAVCPGWCRVRHCPVPEHDDLISMSRCWMDSTDALLCATKVHDRGGHSVSHRFVDASMGVQSLQLKVSTSRSTIMQQLNVLLGIAHGVPVSAAAARADIGISSTRSQQHADMRMSVPDIGCLGADGHG